METGEGSRCGLLMTLFGGCMVSGNHVKKNTLRYRSESVSVDIPAQCLL